MYFLMINLIKSGEGINHQHHLYYRYPSRITGLQTIGIVRLASHIHISGSAMTIISVVPLCPALSAYIS